MGFFQDMYARAESSKSLLDKSASNVGTHKVIYFSSDTSLQKDYRFSAEDNAVIKITFDDFFITGVTLEGNNHSIIGAQSLIFDNWFENTLKNINFYDLSQVSASEDYGEYSYINLENVTFFNSKDIVFNILATNHRELGLSNIVFNLYDNATLYLDIGLKDIDLEKPFTQTILGNTLKIIGDNTAKAIVNITTNSIANTIKLPSLYLDISNEVNINNVTLNINDITFNKYENILRVQNSKVVGDLLFESTDSNNKININSSNIEGYIKASGLYSSFIVEQSHLGEISLNSDTSKFSIKGSHIDKMVFASNSVSVNLEEDNTVTELIVNGGLANIDISNGSLQGNVSFLGEGHHSMTLVNSTFEGDVLADKDSYLVLYFGGTNTFRGSIYGKYNTDILVRRNSSLNFKDTHNIEVNTLKLFDNSKIQIDNPLVVNNFIIEKAADLVLDLKNYNQYKDQSYITTDEIVFGEQKLNVVLKNADILIDKDDSEQVIKLLHVTRGEVMLNFKGLNIGGGIFSYKILFYEHDGIHDGVYLQITKIKSIRHLVEELNGFTSESERNKAINLAQYLDKIFKGRKNSTNSDGMIYDILDDIVNYSDNEDWTRNLLTNLPPLDNGLIAQVALRSLVPTIPENYKDKTTNYWVSIGSWFYTLSASGNYKINGQTNTLYTGIKYNIYDKLLWGVGLNTGLYNTAKNISNTATISSQQYGATTYLGYIGFNKISLVQGIGYQIFNFDIRKYIESGYKDNNSKPRGVSYSLDSRLDMDWVERKFGDRYFINLGSNIGWRGDWLKVSSYSENGSIPQEIQSFAASMQQVCSDIYSKLTFKVDHGSHLSIALNIGTSYFINSKMPETKFRFKNTNVEEFLTLPSSVKKEHFLYKANLNVNYSFFKDKISLNTSISYCKSEIIKSIRVLNSISINI